MHSMFSQGGLVIIRSYTPSCIRSLGLLVSCQMHLKVCFMVRIGVTNGKFEFPWWWRKESKLVMNSIYGKRCYAFKVGNFQRNKHIVLLYVTVCFQVNTKSCFHYSGFSKGFNVWFSSWLPSYTYLQWYRHMLLIIHWWCSNFLHVFIGCVLYIISLFWFHVKTLYALTSMWN